MKINQYCQRENCSTDYIDSAWHSSARERQTTAGGENKLFSSIICVNISKKSWMSKGTNRKLQMRFRLTPILTTLD